MIVPWKYDSSMNDAFLWGAFLFRRWGPDSSRCSRWNFCRSRPRCSRPKEVAVSRHFSTARVSSRQQVLFQNDQTVPSHVNFAAEAPWSKKHMHLTPRYCCRHDEKIQVPSSIMQFLSAGERAGAAAPSKSSTGRASSNIDSLLWTTVVDCQLLNLDTHFDKNLCTFSASSWKFRFHEYWKQQHSSTQQEVNSLNQEISKAGTWKWRLTFISQQRWSVFVERWLHQCPPLPCCK